jgi:hypothetical protein
MQVTQSVTILARSLSYCLQIFSSWMLPHKIAFSSYSRRSIPSRHDLRSFWTVPVPSELSGVSDLCVAGDSSSSSPRSLPRAEARAGHHANCPLLSFDFHQNWNVLTDCIKTHEHTISLKYVQRFNASGQIDMATLIVAFLQLHWECSWELVRIAGIRPEFEQRIAPMERLSWVGFIQSTPSHPIS